MLAAEAVPRRLRRLVCLSAFLVKNGDCFTDVRSYAGYPANPGPPHFAFSADRRVITAIPSLVRARWYNDCSDADIDYAIARYKPVPAEELTAPVTLHRCRLRQRAEVVYSLHAGSRR